MNYNIQFEDHEVLTIEDEARPAPMLKGDSLLVNSKLYEVIQVVHNLDDGKAWVVVK